MNKPKGVYSGRAQEELQYRTAYREIWKKIQGSLLTDEEIASVRFQASCSRGYSGPDWIIDKVAEKTAQAQIDKVIRMLYANER